MGNITVEFLNSKQRKIFFQALTKQYGYTGSTDYVLYKGGQDKYYVISRGVENIPFTEMRVRMAGLYVASWKGDDLRLSMDGAMFFGADCANCFVEADEEQKNAWMKGEDIPGEGHGHCIVTYKTYILGCGSRSNGWVKNFVAKGRRITEPHETRESRVPPI